MLSDPITLYKLMILYMLDHVNFPLTNSQLTDFFLDHEYTTYFTLQQALNPPTIPPATRSQKRVTTRSPSSETISPPRSSRISTAT